MKLTDTAVTRLALPADAGDKIFFDDEIAGFGVRVRAGGSRKFVLHYRIAGKQRRHTIGNVGVLKVEEARRKARKIIVAVDDGRDPAIEKATARTAAGLLFSAVKIDYLEYLKARSKPRTIEEATRYLDKHLKPLHGLAFGAVSRATVAARLRTIIKDNGPVAANRARSTLSAMYAWGIGEGLAETNPVIGTNSAEENGSRERVLSEAELATIWNAADPATDYGRIVRLLMLTGQRRVEIGNLEWCELVTDGNRHLIAMPASKTKNGRAHDVPLSAPALAVMDGHMRVDGRAFVFGRGAGGFSGWSHSKIALDAACGVTDWTLHDLRRTAATGMADLGVAPHVIEAVLNHVSGHKAGVAGIYNRSTYANEKRAALDSWATHLAMILAKSEGANVVPLRAVQCAG